MHQLSLTAPRAGFTKSAGTLLETLLCAFDKRPPRLFSRIDEEGVRTAVDISMRLSHEPEDGKRLVFRTVFGVTEEMPVAALSYLLPSVRLAEELEKTQINRAAMPTARVSPPRIEFLQMREAGVRLNRLDGREVARQGDVFQRVARAYLERFHPRIASNVSFLDDGKITPELLRNPIFKLAEFMVGFVGGSNRKTLRDMARRHGKESGFRTYAALHPFIHEVVEKGDNSSALVSFGADSERVFYGLRRTLRPLLRLDRHHRTLPTMQFITSHSTPPYHMMSGGDIPLSTALNDPDGVIRNTDVHTPVRKALDQLFADVGSKSVFCDFLKSL